uniref:Putative secreted protein n=1 Tax=Ixodes ricinus TaxID=34613 RepID=A0A6B0TZS1_IXORI
MVTSFMTMIFLSCHVTSSIVFRMARKRWIPSGLTPAETAAARRWRSSIFCRALVLSCQTARDKRKKRVSMEIRAWVSRCFSILIRST